MKNKYVKTITLALLSVLVLAGCGNKPAPSEPSSETPTDVTSEEPSSEEPSSEEPSSEEPSSEEPSSEEPSSEEPSSEEPVKEDLVFTLKDLSKVYDGTPVDPNYPSFTINGILITPICEYKVAGANDGTYTKEGPVNAGDYVFRLRVDETEKYNAFEDTKPFTISKKPLTFTMPDPYEVPYVPEGTGTDSIPLTTANGVLDVDGLVELRVSFFVDGTNDPITEVGLYNNPKVTYKLQNPNYALPTDLPTNINTFVIKEGYEFIAYIQSFNPFDGTGIKVQIMHGELHVNDKVLFETDQVVATVTEIRREGFNVSPVAVAGDEVYLTFSGITKSNLHYGDALTVPGSTTYPAYDTFEGLFIMNTTEETGRTDPIPLNFEGKLYDGFNYEDCILVDIRDGITNAPLTEIKPNDAVIVRVKFKNGPQIIIEDLYYEYIEAGVQIGAFEWIDVNF